MVSHHALQVSGGGVVSHHALQVSRPTPRGELEGSVWGVSRPTPKGSPGPHPGGSLRGLSGGGGVSRPA